MDDKDTGAPSAAAMKDPMRDSLLSTDSEVDSPLPSGSPFDNEGRAGGGQVPPIVFANGWPAGDEQLWEGVGQCQDIYNAASLSSHSEVGDGASPAPGDTGHIDACQQELEFDYWQGQFQFYSPALQDYPFIPVNMIEKLAESDDGTASPNSVVYKDLINTVSNNN